jgi:hypothetical protein
MELYLLSLNTPAWRGAQLKHRDNFTFYHHELSRIRLSCLFLKPPDAIGLFIFSFGIQDLIASSVYIQMPVLIFYSEIQKSRDPGISQPSSLS